MARRRDPQERFRGLTPGQYRALQEISNSTSQYVLGVDEVGYGAWAGPVTVGACVVPREFHDDGVRDSKQYSSQPARERAATKVLEHALWYAVVSLDSARIDQDGLLECLHSLTRDVIYMGVAAYPDAMVVQDGDVPVTIEPVTRTMTWLSKADRLVPAVSAASVLAKVARDRFMVEQDALYPGYGFAKHKGYGTPAHMDALRTKGVCALHRMSYRPVRHLLHLHDGDQK